MMKKRFGIILMSILSVLIITASCTKKKDTIELKKYTISFNTDGGSEVKNVSVMQDKKLVKPTDPTKDAYTFVEWQFNNVAFDFESVITKDIILVAKWAKIPVYTVSFNTDGGNVIDAVKVIKDKKVSKPNDPKKDDYTFVEWQLNDLAFNFESVITRDITLVAKWSKIPVYTVSFNTDGGNVIDALKVIKDKKLSKPTDPIKDAYTFVEWQLNNVAFDFESVITKDITLLAKWDKIPVYTVSFNTDGGNVIDALKVIKDKKLSKPTDPIKDAYTFVEWQLNNVAFDFESVITKDITLLAKWDKIPVYTVSFNTDGGNVIDALKVIKDKKVTKPTDPIKDAYTFVEWQFNNVAFDFESVITKDITLLAKWDKIPVYTVSFNTDGGNVIDALKVIKDKKLVKPTDPTRKDYAFIAWQLDGVAFDFESVITKDITLVAKWESNGSLDDWNVENVDGGVKITLYKKVAVDLVIPARINGLKVVNIGSTMLSDKNFDKPNVTLLSVDMSKSIYLTRISHKAFSYCKNLNNIIFSKNLIHIEYAAFANCISLSNILLPDSLEIIEGGAFRDCTLTDVSFGKNLKEIRDNDYWAAFGGSNIEIIDLFNTKLELLGEGIFFSGGVKVIKLPTTLLNIGNVVTLNNPIEEIHITRKELPLTKLNGTQAFVTTPSEFKGKIFYPKGTNYKNEPNWKDYTSAQWIEQ